MKENLKLKMDIVEALSILRQQVENPLTDAHLDFFPAKRDSINETINFLQSNELSLENLETATTILGFKRFFPLLEMAEKLMEMEENVFPSQKKQAHSYSKIGVPTEHIENLLKSHNRILQCAVMEGIFRKGLCKTDREAWSGILYNMGGRILYDYINSIIRGWLHEDLVSKWLEDEIKKNQAYSDVRIERKAHDSNRIFKYKKKSRPISGEPDLVCCLKKGDKGIKFFVEIQHLTEKTIKKRDRLILVPAHRVKVSEEYGRRYIFIAPCILKAELSLFCILEGPLIEKKKGYVQGQFFNLDNASDTIMAFIESLLANEEKI